MDLDTPLNQIFTSYPIDRATLAYDPKDRSWHSVVTDPTEIPPNVLRVGQGESPAEALIDALEKRND